MFDADCFRVCHCGTGRIELLSYDALGERRSVKSIVATLPLDVYFESILLHEIVHAAFDDMPCPLKSCATTAEYLAYALQIESLPPRHRQEMTGGINPDFIISRDAINVMMLFMAPDPFAIRAWAHFSQRPDQKSYVQHIMTAAIPLDRIQP